MLNVLNRFEQAEEILYSKLDNADARIVELEERLKEAIDNEKSMRYHLEDVEYSEVTDTCFHKYILGST